MSVQILSGQTHRASGHITPTLEVGTEKVQRGPVCAPAHVCLSPHGVRTPLPTPPPRVHAVYGHVCPVPTPFSTACLPLPIGAAATRLHSWCASLSPLWVSISCSARVSPWLWMPGRVSSFSWVQRGLSIPMPQGGCLPSHPVAGVTPPLPVWVSFCPHK